MTMFSKEEIGQKLRTAREAAGMTRPDLSKATGVPTKSIEKYETGVQEAGVCRMGEIAQVLGVRIEDLIGIKVPAPAIPSEDPPWDTDEPAEEALPLQLARATLETLDRMRLAGFDQTPRKAQALVEQARRELGFLEIDELEVLAKERGLYCDGCEGSADVSITAVFSTMYAAETKQEAILFSHNVAERLIDTSVLGVDLWSIEFDAVTDFADRLQEDGLLEDRPWFWGDHAKAIPIIRPAAHQKALHGSSLPKDNPALFPARAA